MKSIKILSLVIIAALTLVGCNKENDGKQNKELQQKLANEWCIATWNGEESPARIYIDFNADGSYDMYQQAYTLTYVHFNGTYNLSGDIVTGTYADGSNWKCGYKASISADGTTLTLDSQEDVSITSVYNLTVIPEEVKAEADETRSYTEVLPLL